MEITQLLLQRPIVEPAEAVRPAVEAAADDQARTAEQLRSVARQFETVFLNEIVKQMKETVDYTSLDEEDETGEQVQSMYWSFMADSLGRQGGVGYWKEIYEKIASARGIDTRQFPAENRVLDECA
jgi:flagellar protein FlgJ